jgi:hypothetical protein
LALVNNRVPPADLRIPGDYNFTAGISPNYCPRAMDAKHQSIQRAIKNFKPHINTWLMSNEKDEHALLVFIS